VGISRADLHQAEKHLLNSVFIPQ